MFRKLLIVGMLIIPVLGQQALADAKSKDTKQNRSSSTFFQIKTAVIKDDKISFSGYWVLPDRLELSIQANSSKPPPKPPSVIRPVVYILPVCKSELENAMDDFSYQIMIDEWQAEGSTGPRPTRSGRDDWCARLKDSLGKMGIPFVDH